MESDKKNTDGGSSVSRYRSFTDNQTGTRGGSTHFSLLGCRKMESGPKLEEWENNQRPTTVPGLDFSFFFSLSLSG